ncbi:hypothetical protein B0I37DRAFT_445447 [Chaetomium sp. MPI-CAGE-AT-0009]|nr:hypothetical protein B0I37DRAFT_445447 [Chaetomium sp. MPI-CAGE-AT-0009]
MAPIPIAIVERDKDIATPLLQQLLPEFDTVMVCDAEFAESFLLDTCAGKLDIPSTVFGIGSNGRLPVSERKAPRAIIITPTLPDDGADFIENAFRSSQLSHVVFVRMQPEDLYGGEINVSNVRNRLKALVANGRLNNE